jgi:hypothetical protein
MRLANVSHDHALKERVVMRLMSLMSRQPVPDVVKTLLYRRDFFGRPLSEMFQGVLRGPSEWTVGERELFAAWTSKLEACHF